MVELCICVLNPLITPASLSLSFLDRDFGKVSAFPTNWQHVSGLPCAFCRCHYPLETAHSQFAFLLCNQCSQMETALKFTFSNLSFIFLLWCFMSGFPVVLASLVSPQLPLSRLCFPQAYDSLSILTCKGISVTGWLSLEL